MLNVDQRCLHARGQMKGAQDMTRSKRYSSNAPVRDVGRRSSGCTTGSVPVPNSEQALLGEGRLDIDLQIVVSVLPWVRQYRAQPIRLPIEVDGRKTFYTPDGRLLGLARPLCVEVKPLDKLRKISDLEVRKNAIKHALGKIGEDFAIWTEVEIRAEPMFSNAMHVWSTAQNVRPFEVVDACAALRRCAFSTMIEVVDMLGGGPLGWRLALALVGQKVLAIDLTREIGADTPVRAGIRGWI